MSIQILQYEFLGPIPLEEWGPPMEKLVYLILSRDKDKFNIVYLGNCQKTNDKAFFVQHPQYKCWIEKSGSEKSLYLAILPLFESSDDHRENVYKKILTHYKPVCNSSEIVEKKPDYVVRKSENTIPDPEQISCPCCGAKMIPEKVLEKSTLFRCTGCSLSDTKLNS
ncbi:MAG: hypothetical protein K5781_08350 [Nitrosopumilus sp.]|nr:hypothetical protein [Nitrosopumilus sp.]